METTPTQPAEPQTSSPAGLPEQFVSEAECFAVLFAESVRPAERTVRKWKKRRIFPFVRIGRLTFCDPQAVRAAITKFTVAPRG